jgi:hypothetical protein
VSWDISICKFSQSYESIDDIPEDEKPVPIGSLTAVRAAISRVFPSTDWSDPEWGVFEAPFGSIEFNLSSEDPVKSLMLHVRAGDEIVPPIVQLCREEGWQAVDGSEGAFLEQSPVPEAGLRSWRGFLDQILDGGES